MKITSSCLVLAALLAQAHAETSLTIYNQNFGVVRDTVPLDLQQGVNQVRFADTTAHLEPDSVILRDPKSGVKLSILEQNYRADPISSGLLLNLNEGKEIEFFVRETNKPDRIVKGRIIRSGYVTHNQSAMQRYGNRYYQGQMAMAQGTAQPVIEVEGQLQFSLPGEPRFPALADDTILKPTLDWRIHTDHAAKLNAEICYVTGGMSWEASYNVVSPEKGDLMDLTGWVTIDNQSGKTFKDAKLQLIAGDVAKLQPEEYGGRPMAASAGFMRANASVPVVTEKAFDEYHLYSLPLATTLHDRETKQVEFVRAAGVKSQRLFIYDGVAIDQNQYRGWTYDNIRNDQNYGTQSNPKVWVIREIKNSEDNKLGMPLPKGKVRFYRQDDDGKLQFVGEDVIDHTARDETLRLYTGNAFDLVGERKRTNIKVDSSNHWIDESFEIKVRNRKQDESVEIRVVEHLYRWTNWEIREPSNAFEKKDAQTIELRVALKPGEEKTLTYTVHYSW
ncbi:DUF4139 domain-containing protein [Prosthecobacter sp.]|uniref:DUF4139 domain-containing protein n=1 Tax=Prosthecobacter sp. TaxID=1965333 RepID=UPI002AB88383|nr:DUF4139 domain-containing protein [Prosthecobacter sp.]MDZ4404182.1 hypothetical protein [Prosthecobacter sp.]